MRKRKWIPLIAVGIILLAYLCGPVIASIFEIGDRRGPKIYPAAVHESIYMTVWEMTPHQEKKPRIPVMWRAEYRPWFYGMYSKNTDWNWLQQEYEKRRQQREQEAG